jgi:hypothetical protein
VEYLGYKISNKKGKECVRITVFIQYQTNYQLGASMLDMDASTFGITIREGIG